MKLMPPALLQTLRSRWFALCIHVALWVLLYLAIVHLSGKAPPYHDTGSLTSPPQVVAPVAKMESVVTASVVTKTSSNAVPGAPFLTRYFVPPPTPAPPPPPTTRKLEVTYLGFYQSSNGPKFAVLNLAGGLVTVRVGSLVATNVYVASAGFTTAVLTNTTAQTNLLQLNAKKEIEVPIRCTRLRPQIPKSRPI